MTYQFQTSDLVCSRMIEIELDDRGERVKRVQFVGGCPGNLVEVMTCVGGCVGGAGVVMPAAKGAKAVENFATKGKV